MHTSLLRAQAQPEHSRAHSADVELSAAGSHAQFGSEAGHGTSKSPSVMLQTAITPASVAFAGMGSIMHVPLAARAMQHDHHGSVVNQLISTQLIVWHHSHARKRSCSSVDVTAANGPTEFRVAHAGGDVGPEVPRG